MASCVLTLTAEMELVHDAIGDIERVFRALAKFHGHSYRALEQRIERLMDGEAEMGEPRTHWIGGGRLVFEPYPEMKAIICEARALGVL